MSVGRMVANDEIAAAAAAYAAVQAAIRASESAAAAAAAHAAATGGNLPLPGWKRIKDEGPRSGDDDLYNTFGRDSFVNNFAWAVPSEEAVREIAGFVGEETVLEVGSGKGLWAALLADEGVKVKATDGFSSHGLEKIPPEQRRVATYTDVENLSHLEAVARYGDEAGVLMMVWPPQTSMDEETLKAFEERGGVQLVFVGEDRGGCTGSNAFWKRVGKNWEEVKAVGIPKWESANDKLILYRRKGAEVRVGPTSSTSPAGGSGKSAAAEVLPAAGAKAKAPKSAAGSRVQFTPKTEAVKVGGVIEVPVVLEAGQLEQLMGDIAAVEGRSLTRTAAEKLHVTILGPEETKREVGKRAEKFIAQGMSKGKAPSAARDELRKELASVGGRPVVTGIGKATDPEYGRTVYFLTVAYPEGQAVRGEFGLGEKDLHITLASTKASEAGDPVDVHGQPKSDANVARFGDGRPDAAVKVSAGAVAKAAAAAAELAGTAKWAGKVGRM